MVIVVKLCESLNCALPAIFIGFLTVMVVKTNNVSVVVDLCPNSCLFSLK